MEQIKNVQDLLKHEVQMLFDAEEQQVMALQRLIKKTSNPDLKTAFQQHLQETEKQKTRLEEAAKILNIEPEGDENVAVRSLIEESEKLLNSIASPETLDVAILAAVQKLEHHEISCYGTAAFLAETLGMNNVKEMLGQTLQEEKAVDEKLNKLAKTKINIKAVEAGVRM